MNRLSVKYEKLFEFLPIRKTPQSSAASNASIRPSVLPIVFSLFHGPSCPLSEEQRVLAASYDKMEGNNYVVCAEGMHYEIFYRMGTANLYCIVCNFAFYHRFFRKHAASFGFAHCRLIDVYFLAFVHFRG